MENIVIKKTFNGKKIREARELQRMDITALSEITGISRQSITNYENGHFAPKPENLDLLSRALKVKWGFFLLPSNETSKPTFFRSKSHTTKSIRVSSSRALDMMEYVVEAIEKFTTPPPVNIPYFEIGDIEQLSNKQIEEYALECRKYWELGLEPIEDLIGHLEMQGVIIYTSDSKADALDAFSRWNEAGTRPFVHLCTGKVCAVRSRFDLAHELGHLILHRNVTDTEHKKHFDLIEDQANYFAGAFLLPEESFADDIFKLSIEAFAIIKKKWLVSVGAMIKRAHNIGILSDTNATSFWVYYSRRGWRKREPLDDIIPMEEPLWIREAVKILIEQGMATPADILAQIPYENNYVAEFLKLGILEQGSTASEIKNRIKSQIEGQRASNIIKFNAA